MVNYKNGKIYRLYIEYYDDEKQIQELNYIGSTTLSLSKRYGKHKENYNRWIKEGKPENKKKTTSVYLFEKGEPKIELLSPYSCNNKEELYTKEGEYIRKYDCVNRNIIGRTQKEYNIDNYEKIAESRKTLYILNKEQILNDRKKYYEEHKIEIAEKSKVYRDKNKEHIKEHDKIYRNKNKEQLLEKSMVYYENNKTKIAEIRKSKITCKCGSILRKYDLSRHLNSMIHNNYLKDNLLHLTDIQQIA